MHDEFFSSHRTNYNNPTLTSSHVFASMYGGYVQPKIYREPGPVYSVAPSKIGRSSSVGLLAEPMYSKNPETIVSSIREPLKTTPRLSDQSQSQSKSSLSNYGRNSLTTEHPLMATIDRQVFNKQQHQRNIITQLPRKYRESIRVFPSLRREGYDADYYKRQSFLKGHYDRAYGPPTDARALVEKLRMG